MPEVRRGSLQVQINSTSSITPDPSISARPNPQSQSQSADQVAQQTETTVKEPPSQRRNTIDHTGSSGSSSAATAAADAAAIADSRKSLSYALRPQAEAYYDSRAATQSEWRRRAKNLQDYYDDNPKLLPQLPFTWHHGWRRWKLWFFAFCVFVDASAVPIALYYGMQYAGDVPGWIIFAVVTTIWGGPTYLEFAIRTLRLVKKERFYRPLGTESRWCFDMCTWVSSLTIFVVTVLFIVGSAPHDVFLRVLCMPAPAILYCLGGSLAYITLYNHMGWRAPCRISSTAKGDEVLPGAYYFIEDVVAVNAGAGRPFREALAARYKASPRFRRMLYVQSVFWSIPALVLAIPLTVIAIIPAVPATGAYGVCWSVPFLWAVVWGFITIRWCKQEMVRERLEWETSDGEKAIPHSGQTSVLA